MARREEGESMTCKKNEHNFVQLLNKKGKPVVWNLGYTTIGDVPKGNAYEMYCTKCGDVKRHDR